jgi:hypothetical protein
MRLAIAILVCSIPAFASDVYFAQAAAGGANGADCADALAISYFNTSGNWSATPTGTQLGPGVTAHMCGTFTGTAGAGPLISTQQSAASGNVMTIKFETGAGMTAPYWSTSGALAVNHSYIVVDGGTNGYITATANGTNLMYQQDSEGLHIGNAGSPHDVEVKNMTVSNMCVRASGDSDTGCTGQGIRMLSGGGNVLIHNNTVHDVVVGVEYVVSVTESGDQAYSNTIYNRDAGIIYCTCAASIAITNTLIHNNSIGSAANWDDPAGANHHDGIHLFNSGSPLGVMTGALVYNNYFYGDIGTHSTALIFHEDAAQGTVIFNNLIAPSAGSPSDGHIFNRGNIGTYNRYVIANTIIATAGGICIGNATASGTTIENNVCSGTTIAISIEDTGSHTGLVIDYNDYYQATEWAYPAIYSSLAAWQAACSCDSHSITTNPSLLSNGTLSNSSSPAYQTGTNLTSLSVTALDTGAPLTFGVGGACGVGGCVSRPSMGAWDMGAFPFLSVSGSYISGVSASGATIQ